MGRKQIRRAHGKKKDVAWTRYWRIGKFNKRRWGNKERVAGTAQKDGRGKGRI